MLDQLYDDGHETILLCQDELSGLKAIIAVHSTQLGPAAGGCRFQPYSSIDAAAADVLRLSKAMTLKNALAGLPLGGGKSVIIGDPGADGAELRLDAFAGFVDRLAGTYWTAEDVGVGLDSVEILARRTRYVFGRAGGTGDPAAYTARGGFQGLRAAVAHRFGSGDLSGVRVAVQGVGNVGLELCALLHKAGAELIVADPDPARVAIAQSRFDARPVPTTEIIGVDADVLAPCALGGTICPASVDRLRVGVVAGVANNQLATPDMGDALRLKYIVYAPDYVVNAGGMLNAAFDILGGYDETETLRRIDLIHDRTAEILIRADAEGRASNFVADDMAMAIVAAGPQS